MSYIKHFIFSMLSLTFIGCKENLNYSYLMNHPHVLKKEIENCHSDISSSSEREKYCRMVMFAAENMLSFLKQQQENPEEFGNRLLTLQTKVVKTKIDLSDAQKLLDTLKEKNASDEEIASVKVTRDKLKTMYKEQSEEMKVMLAVIGINTPE